MGGCDKSIWAWEAEESPLLEAVVRKRQLNTRHAEKGLVGAVVICKVWWSAVTL
jgi:hypothetical protein